MTTIFRQDNEPQNARLGDEWIQTGIGTEIHWFCIETYPLRFEKISAEIELPLAAVQVAPADPTETASVTSVMMGLGSTCKIKPSVTGRVHATFTGLMHNTTPNKGGTAQIYHGTGTPPANGDAPTGEGIGVAYSYTGSDSHGQTLALDSITTDLSDEIHWFDIAASCISGGTITFSDVSVTLVEV